MRSRNAGARIAGRDSSSLARVRIVNRALLVRLRDDAAMARAMDALLADFGRPLAGLGAAARRAVLRHHTPERRA